MFSGRRGVSLPAPADSAKPPTRRCRRSCERNSTSGLRSGSSARPRARLRARRDCRLPPRAGASVPRRSSARRARPSRLARDELPRGFWPPGRARSLGPITPRPRSPAAGVELLPEGDPARLEALLSLASAHSRRGELEPSRGGLRSSSSAKHGSRGNRPRRGSRPPQPRFDSQYEPIPKRAPRTSSRWRSRSLPRSRRPVTCLHWLRPDNRIGMCRFMLGRAGEGEADLEKQLSSPVAVVTPSLSAML